MRLGIPGGLLFNTYEPFVKTFFGQLPLNVVYSLNSTKEILKLGQKHCVDEACLPIKIFHGHVMKLQETCDFIAVPRIVNCDFNQSICPKFDGLPELVKSGTKKDNYCFTKPMNLYNHPQLIKNFQSELRSFGIDPETTKQAFQCAVENQRKTTGGINEKEYKYKVFLAGHPYHIYDKFANMNIFKKLHDLGIGVVTEEWISKYDKSAHFKELIKNPYWLFFMNSYGAAKELAKEKSIDGIIVLSSFNCGTDSFTIEMMKNNMREQLPFLVLKLDEQSGEAGIDTRLEAFQEIIKRKRQTYTLKEALIYEDYIPPFGRCPSPS